VTNELTGQGPVDQAVGRPIPEGAADGGLTDLVMTCAFAVQLGQQTVTITAVGKRPLGFPRGELLSVGTSGRHNYAVCPLKVLAWIHGRTRKPPHVGTAAPLTVPGG
jgi:hypothetical protein